MPTLACPRGLKGKAALRCAYLSGPSQIPIVAGPRSVSHQLGRETGMRQNKSKHKQATFFKLGHRFVPPGGRRVMTAKVP